MMHTHAEARAHKNVHSHAYMLRHMYTTELAHARMHTHNHIHQSSHMSALLTYLCPSLPVEHRPPTTRQPPPPTPHPPPSHSVLGCSSHSGPVGPLLLKLCFSVSPPTVARPASLPLPLRVPGQGLACGAGCWLPEGVSDLAPLPPQYLLGHAYIHTYGRIRP